MAPIFGHFCHRGDGKPDLEGHKRGQYAAAIMKRGLRGQGWKLVVTGHSLGAGVAALLSLKLRHTFSGAFLVQLTSRDITEGTFLLNRRWELVCHEQPPNPARAEAAWSP